MFSDAFAVAYVTSYLHFENTALVAVWRMDWMWECNPTNCRDCQEDIAIHKKCQLAGTKVDCREVNASENIQEIKSPGFRDGLDMGKIHQR